MFVIFAFGGNDEQLSAAGIQLKYASGKAGHNRRLRRRNDAASAAILLPARMTEWEVFVRMARPERFELPTSWFVARHSIQLSYGRAGCAKSPKMMLHFLLDMKICFKHWRRERDSNPRWGYKPHTPLAGERLQPLGHLSVLYRYRLAQ